MDCPIVDLAPIEVGMTSQRFQILDFTNAVNFGEVVIISRKVTSDVSGIHVHKRIGYTFSQLTKILVFFMG